MYAAYTMLQSHSKDTKIIGNTHCNWNNSRRDKPTAQISNGKNVRFVSFFQINSSDQHQSIAHNSDDGHNPNTDPENRVSQHVTHSGQSVALGKAFTHVRNELTLAKIFKCAEKQGYVFIVFVK